MDNNVWMSILLFVVAGYGSYIVALTYRKRRMPIARTMFWTMLCASFYSVGYGFELLSRNLGQMKLALQIEYLGIPFVSTLWLFLAIQFTGRAARNRKPLALFLAIVPCIIFVLHLTNDWNHLIYKDYIPNASSFGPPYVTLKGPWYWVHVIYNYAILVVGFLLFIPMYYRSSRIVRKQIVILMLGAAAPMLSNLVYLFGVVVDLTPFGFILSGLAYIWGILRFNLLRLTPLAMNKVFHTIRDGVVIMGEDNQVISFNRAAESVFPGLGKRRAPIPLDEAFRGHEPFLERIIAAQLRDDRFPFQVDRELRTLHFNCGLTVLYDTTDQPIGKMLILNDVTELKENESRLRENARQLSELNSFKDKLFTIVAHDIRDPVAVLVSMTDLLRNRMQLSEKEFSEWMEEMHGQMRSTLSLIDSLLDWYRSQKGQVTYEPNDWNLRQAVNQSFAVAGGKAALRQIALTERIDPSVTVYADREMLDLILRNLISNAIKYASSGGNVEVAAAVERTEVIVSVTDDGPGIDRETAERLRQEMPTFRKESEEEEARFGLTLTREFVRINGGRLWFDSESGRGTRFYFTVPCSAQRFDSHSPIANISQ
ncbi:histidine kinase N-terminal 7TM domain-containing protein [Cohnella sp. AR92]|uniref:sensor histidine kinase n=1 Tax=Cohnella sp. AR92 TaxID=648716 RepID=UPI000F8D303E|nr:histidine kinase N-terminal 7TM domain-containing protein [Cohnella sp. AR92]RUS42848.1 hypothetical protein ELR57_25930 [Cohnella sp. AR92]